MCEVKVTSLTLVLLYLALMCGAKIHRHHATSEFLENLIDFPFSILCGKENYSMNHEQGMV